MSWPIKSLHQIEVSSNCNLRCVYCTSPTLGRAKMNMDRATFERALDWVRYFVREGTQGELNLAGIGESQLNPLFNEFVALAREALGWNRRLIFTTNGILTTPEFIAATKPHGLKVFVSLHRPEKAKAAIDLLYDAGMLLGVSTDPATGAIDWAGQVDWKMPKDNLGQPCDWSHQGWAMVLADGRISSCCLDSDGSGVIGTVNDHPGSVVGKPYRLCKTCHFDCGVEGWRDRVEGRKVVA